MFVGDITDVYCGHVVIGTSTETGGMNALYNSINDGGDVPFDLCFMKVECLCANGSVLEIYVEG